MRIHRVVVVTFLLLCCLEGTSCLKSTQEPMRVGIDTFVGFAPVYLARDWGYFDKYDLKVDPQVIMDTMERTTALAGGRIDALCTTADSLLLAAANGVDLVIVAAVDESAGADGIVSRTNISSIEDLKGKTVAFQEAMPSHFFLLTLLRGAGMQPSDILGVHMNADDAGNAFISGKVDAAVTWEPWLSRATESGQGRILVSTAQRRGVLIDVLAVRRTVLERRERDVVALYKGWMQAVDEWKRNRDNSERLMSERLKLPLAEFHKNVGTVHFADTVYNESLFDRKNPKSIWTLAGQAIEIWRSAGVLRPDPSFDTDRHVTDRIVMSAREKHR